MRLRNVTNLYEGNPFASCNLCFIDGSMKVSKVVLAIDNDYFHKLFLTNIEQMYYKYIHLWDKFEFNYTKILSIFNIQNELNVSAKDDDLILRWLKKNCADIDICTIFENTLHPALRSYNEFAKRFIKSNFEDLIEINSFDSLDKHSIFEIFDEKFNKTQNQAKILGLITRWIEHDYDGRKSGWLELAMTINFGMFSSQFILNYLSSNPQICEIPELVKFLISRIEDVENIRVLSGRNRNLWSTYLFGGSCNKTNVFKIREENVQKIGKYAFILGGFDNRIERFDLETCESSILSLKIIGETYYLSSSAIGSQTYVIGGSVCDQSVDTIRCLDSEKMKWMDKPNLLKDMVGHDSIVIDGVIYVTTGNDSASLQRFDPRESKWNILKDIPSGNGTCAVTTFGKISPALDHWKRNLGNPVAFAILKAQNGI